MLLGVVSVQGAPRMPPKARALRVAPCVVLATPLRVVLHIVAAVLSEHMQRAFEGVGDGLQVPLMQAVTVAMDGCMEGDAVAIGIESGMESGMQRGMESRMRVHDEAMYLQVVWKQMQMEQLWAHAWVRHHHDGE